jgi:hypothetical protein
MKRLKPDKLHVEYRDVTPTEPVLGRKYTQTHSDITADLFVTIGLLYAFDKINPTRDEVLAEWRYYDNNNSVFLWAYVYVGGYGPALTKFRYNIFRKELPLALAAIRNADKDFYIAHPELDKAPIYIYFDSTYPNYRGYYYYGTPVQYKDYYRT